MYRVRNGRISNTWSTNLAVKAWASMWWIGINGLDDCLHNCLAWFRPTNRDNGRPGRTVTAMASKSSRPTRARCRVRVTTPSMFCLCRSLATGGIMPPKLRTRQFTWYILSVRLPDRTGRAGKYLTRGALAAATPDTLRSRSCRRPRWHTRCRRSWSRCPTLCNSPCGPVATSATAAQRRTDSEEEIDGPSSRRTQPDATGRLLEENKKLVFDF